MSKSEIVKGQKSWLVENDCIRLYITELAAHMAPVTFFRNTEEPVEPFYINPWAEEHIDMSSQPGVLVPLRGDFFCLPFGGNNCWHGENHPPHGDIQEKRWGMDSYEKKDNETKAVFSVETDTRAGKVTKTIRLREGENNIYINDRVSGFAGPACPGHHATFHGRSTRHLSMGPFKTGFTNTSPPDGYGGDEYYSLANFREFHSLKEVPTKWAEEPVTDCSVFPAREGFIDILQVFVEDTADFAWTAVSVPEEGYLWFALKDPGVLPSTVLWMENRGRHASPWNGRNCCIGVEDVCSYLADGLSSSAGENVLRSRGFTTCLELDGRQPLDVRYIQGIVRIPGGFDRVTDAVKTADGITFVSESGISLPVRADLSFLKSGEL